MLSNDQVYYWLQTITVGLVLVASVAIMSHCTLQSTAIKAKAGCDVNNRDSMQSDCIRK